MDNIDEVIRDSLRNGDSLHTCAEVAGLSYSSCRARAIKNGFYTPKNLNNFVVCKRCEKKLPFGNFPYAKAYSIYICKSCLDLKNHKQQISKVGCSTQLYDELMIAQNGKCAICGKDFGHITSLGKKTRLAVDHDHQTGDIRGLLCTRCNRGLGYLGEENIEKALMYCKKC